MGDGRIFLKIFRTSLFNDTYRMSLISAESISLDSTFKRIVSHDEYLFQDPLNKINIFFWALIVFTIFSCLFVEKI